MDQGAGDGDCGSATETRRHFPSLLRTLSRLVRKRGERLERKSFLLKKFVSSMFRNQATSNFCFYRNSKDLCMILFPIKK